MFFITKRKFEEELHKRMDEMCREADRNREMSDLHSRMWKLERRLDDMCRGNSGAGSEGTLTTEATCCDAKRAY